MKLQSKNGLTLFLAPDGDEEINGDAPENDDYRSGCCDVDDKDNSDTEEVTLKADGLYIGNCTYSQVEWLYLRGVHQAMRGRPGSVT